MTTLFDAFNRCDPNSLPDLFRAIGLGQFLAGQVPQCLRNVVPAADTNGSQLATLQSLNLPNTSKATKLMRVYARSATGGGGTVGELSIQSANATPLTGQVAVAPNGDVVVLAADKWLNLDVEYLPARGDVVTLTNQGVTSNAFVIPPQYTAVGVVYLLSCAAVTGTTVGNCIVVAPGSSPGTTHQANLNAAKTSVQFYSVDAVTSCTVTLLVGAAADLATMLASSDEM